MLNIKNSRSLLYILCSVVLVGCDKNKVQEIEIHSAIDTCVQPELIDSSYHVAFLIMDGVYNTELTAPYDIFQHTKYREGIRPMSVFLVAEHCAAVTSFEGIKILPHYTLDDPDLPRIDILVIPSAEHHLDSDLE